jgi:hypothetical protein
MLSTSDHVEWREKAAERGGGGQRNQLAFLRLF